MIQTISVREVRNNLADILEKVAAGGREYVITKNGKPKGKIVPVVQADRISKEEYQKIIKRTSGMWADREDMKDSAEWVRNLRKPRYSI